VSKKHHSEYVDNDQEEERKISSVNYNTPNDSPKMPAEMSSFDP